MKISLIIPVYNGEKYIEKCLTSINNQKYIANEIEPIIINDGSTDRTEIIINEYKEKIKNCKIINKKNQGVSEARNSGLKVATGEYILFLDSDDWLEEDACEKLYKFAKFKKSDLVLFGYKSIVGEKSIKSKFINITEESNEIFIEKLLKVEIDPLICSKFIKRKILLENNIEFISNINCGEDLLFSLEIIINSQKINILEEHLYSYYQREGSVTSKLNHKSEDVYKLEKEIRKILMKILKERNFESEIQYIKFIQEYYYTVVTRVDNYKFKKTFYNHWKKEEINLKENNIYLEFYNKLKFYNKLSLFFYDKTYFGGYFYSIILNFIKKIQKGFR